MLRSLFFSLVLLSTTLGFCSDIEISGPTGGSPGDILIIEVKPIDYVGEGKLTYKYLYALFSGNFDSNQTVISPIEEGRRCIVASRAGLNVKVFVSVASDDGTFHAVGEHTVKLDGTPDPGPDPKPGPSEYGLVELARDTNGVTGVISARKAEAEKLIASYESVVRYIDLEPTVDPIDIMDYVRTQNRKIDSDVLTRWTPWNDRISKQMTQLSEKNKLLTPHQHKLAFLEIIKGLKEIK